MEKTTITISKETRRQLNELKYHYGLRSVEDLIIMKLFEEPTAYKNNTQQNGKSGVDQPESTTRGESPQH